MAQPHLEYVSISLSKKAGDQVTSAGDDGELYTAQERINAINEARANVYTQLLNALGVDKFIDTYKEFIKITDSDAPVVFLGEDEYINDIPPLSQQVIAVYLKDTTNSIDYEAKKIPVQAYVEALVNPYSPYKANADNVKFREFNNKVQILGLPADSYDGFYVYLEQIKPVALGDADDIPDSWYLTLIDPAYQQLLKDSQRRTS